MHMASGCKYLKKAYIARHHKAGQIILKSLARGEFGDSIVYADVGKAESLSAAGVPEPTRLKLRSQDFKLPKGPGLPSSRPDIILGIPACSAQEPNYKKLLLLETKYARDTDISAQVDRATNQHALLASYLADKHHCPVKTIPIILGVSGTIYNTHTVGSLEEAGLKKQALQSTLKALHLHAVRSLHQLYTMYKHHLRTRTGPTTATTGGLDPGG
jgi:hypothetical protein